MTLGHKHTHKEEQESGVSPPPVVLSLASARTVNRHTWRALETNSIVGSNHETVNESTPQILYWLGVMQEIVLDSDDAHEMQRALIGAGAWLDMLTGAMRDATSAQRETITYLSRIRDRMGG